MFSGSVSFDQAIEASQKGGEANVQKIIKYVETHRKNPREIYKCDKKGFNLLAYASANGHSEIFEVVLLGLDIEHVLKAALNDGSYGIFLMLIPYLDLEMLTSTNGEGLTPAQLAQNNGYEGMAIELVQREQQLIAALPPTPQQELDACGYTGPIPVELTCQYISLNDKLMTRPVTLNGFTYEYVAIKGWVEKNRDDKDNFTCPVSRKLIPCSELTRPTDERDLVETLRVKKAIVEFVQAKKIEMGVVAIPPTPKILPSKRCQSDAAKRLEYYAKKSSESKIAPAAVEMTGAPYARLPASPHASSGLFSPSRTVPQPPAPSTSVLTNLTSTIAGWFR